MNICVFKKEFKNAYKHNRIILLEVIIFFCLLIKSINETDLRKLNLESEITIIIEGKGTQQILSNTEYSYHEKVGYELPNQILVNGILQKDTGKYVYNLVNQRNNITMKWNSQITRCNCMFCYLTNIISVDLSKFDSSKVTTFDSFFYETINIKSINLANLNTSSCENMGGMFYNCTKLETLNLSSFDTSNVIVFWAMFFYCKSLKSLDLSNFITSKATDVTAMFCSCSSLIFLNIINFNTSSVSNSYNMFYKVNQNLVYCADLTKISKIKSDLSSYTNKCFEICFTNPKSKIIYNKRECIDKCSNDKEYKYEYNNTCYKSCPNGTQISKINNKLCEEDLYCENYYNYNHSNCLESIPEGYYLNNSLLKTIDKCDEKCQKCNLESVKNNSCLLCNINNGYYP